MASGTWTQNMPGHPISDVSTPPTSGPMTAAVAPAAKYRPSARPRTGPWNDAEMDARPMVSSAAPPTPCTTLPARSTPYAGARALSAAPAANSRPPIVSTGRSPNRSPSRPTARIETANGST